MADRTLLLLGNLGFRRAALYGTVDQSRLPPALRNLLQTYSYMILTMLAVAFFPLLDPKPLIIVLVVILEAGIFLLKRLMERQLDGALAPYLRKDAP